MPKNSKTLGLSLFVMVTAIVASAALSSDGAVFHEPKEVAGLSVLFGAEPEPAITIELHGEEFGPFAVRGARGDAGLYQTRHLFTEAGEYESVLSFRKGEGEEVHTVAFNFNINDRATLEIPGR